jgi:copper chaperone NosL
MSSRIRTRFSRSGPRRAFASFLVTAFLVSLAGCGQGSNTGPGRIHWDRETCEHCQMVISDRRHAIQIRLFEDRQTHAFDDLGCGLLWLDQQGLRAGSDDGPEIWVKDSEAGDWIDARSAAFEAGLTTPMAYGFGVTERGLSLIEVQVAVLETERRRRSPMAKQMDHADRLEDTRGKDDD